MSWPPPELMVKQFVAELNGQHGRFRVFTTGSSRHYLFELIGSNPPLQFPVLKSDLKPEVRRALAHGWGHAPRPKALSCAAPGVPR
jgi:hypothetical protein